MIRRLRKSDIPKLREIHAKAGYGFDFPETEGMIGAHVAVDDEGNVVGFAGAQREAQVFGMLDPTWGTPGARMRIFAELHRPVAEKLEKCGVKEAYVAVDPKFPAFGRRLMRNFGWSKALWDHYWIRVDKCLKLFAKASPNV